MLQMKWQLDVMRSVSGYAEIYAYQYHMSCNVNILSMYCIVLLSFYRTNCTFYCLELQH